MISQFWKEHIDLKLSTLPKGRSFIYFTDAHEGDIHKGESGKGRYESLELIEYIKNRTKIKNVVYGGDILGTERDVPSAKKYNAKFLTDDGGFYTRFGADALLNFGNHDSNCCAQMYATRNQHGFNDQMKMKDLLISDTDIYEDCIKPMEKSGKIVYDEIGIGAIDSAVDAMDSDFLYAKYHAKLGYDDELSEAELREHFKRELTALFKLRYSFTDDENRIKYIMPDCGANALMQFGALSCGWTDIFKLQYFWLAHELFSSPEGYDIVLSTHMLGGNPKDDYHYQPNELLSRNTDLFCKIMTAFQSGGRVSVTPGVDSQESHRLFKALEASIAEAYAKADSFIDGVIDFSARKKPGRILMLSGHWHIDAEFYVTDGKADFYTGQSIAEGVPTVFVISDCSARSMGQMSGKGLEEAAIDVITLADDGDIVFTRIGFGADRILKA